VRRLRQHANPLSLHHLDTGAERLRLPAERPVEVELGCADADFLFERCRSDPQRTYVGVEIRRDLVDRVNRRAQAAGSPQLRAVYANLSHDLERLFSPGQVAVCHINFPDPCFKRKQRKRRFLTPALVTSLARVLSPGGQLAFQSDVFDLALEALALLEDRASVFRNECGPWSFARENPFGARTRRERHCLERGLRIWRFRFQRTAAGRP
jgi:tRNA (guanine-N7-)-methyltransferase